MHIFRTIYDRACYYLNKGQWPWRVRWMNYIYPGFFYHPKKFMKLVGPLMYDEISDLYFALELYGAEMMKETLYICKKVGMSPFLTFGSLLGCYREGGVIKTDNDIDLGILENDADKVSILEEEMIKMGYIVRKKIKPMISFQKNKYNGLFIDFWIYTKSKNADFIYTANINRVGPKDVSIFPYRLEIFSGFKMCEFMGSHVLIPEKVEEYLISTYGNNWRIPTSQELSLTQKSESIFPNRQRITLEEYEQENISVKIPQEVLL